MSFPSPSVPVSAVLLSSLPPDSDVFVSPFAGLPAPALSLVFTPASSALSAFSSSSSIAFFAAAPDDSVFPAFEIVSVVVVVVVVVVVEVPPFASAASYLLFAAASALVASANWRSTAVSSFRMEAIFSLASFASCSIFSPFSASVVRSSTSVLAAFSIAPNPVAPRAVSTPLCSFCKPPRRPCGLPCEST